MLSNTERIWGVQDIRTPVSMPFDESGGASDCSCLAETLSYRMSLALSLIRLDCTRH